MMQSTPINLNTLPFSRLDWAFAEFLSQRSCLKAEQKPRFKNLVAELSFEQSQGHSCLRINRNDQQLALASGLALSIDVQDDAPDLSLKPLIVQENCLYMHRYWFYETRLATQLKQLLVINYQVDDLNTALDHYFPVQQDDFQAIDWQREAAKMALTQAFSMVTGGPGTGKTTTVVKILALLQQASLQPLHIALAAPTGKAAMRLQESIGHSKHGLNCTDKLKQSIPEEVTTLHRLLGAKPPPSPYFKHHAENPLPYDVVVIDEASMVDLALMSKLMDALKPTARLILLGDKDQLASVESGSVLADLTMSLKNHTVELLKSHRFGGVIKELAAAINKQQGLKAWDLLTTPNETITVLTQNSLNYMADKQRPFLTLAQQHASFDSIYAAFNQFQVLCSNRNGPNGVNEINRLVEKKLGLSGHWYNGRPIMITKNDVATQLYNGDIGLCLSDNSQYGQLRVYFLLADGSIKKILPSRLPACETVFAMTIHKSQGSEFNEVLIALPDTLNPVLTKELIYTGITRAKKTVTVVAHKAVFINAVAQKVARYGGLIAKMKGHYDATIIRSS
ncbi:MAG: exodeoxyribonuclease V subunit alpha [Methylococcales bacterium]|nr:exodeoxyribonuclease V subunit alpha [Methylococcales bacterium]